MSDNLEIRVFYSDEDLSYVAAYRHYCGFGDTEKEALIELATALSGVIEVVCEDSFKARTKLEEIWDEFGDAWERWDKAGYYKDPVDPMFPAWRVGKLIKEAREAICGKNESCKCGDCESLSGEGGGTEQGVQSDAEGTNSEG